MLISRCLAWLAVVLWGASFVLLCSYPLLIRNPAILPQNLCSNFVQHAEPRRMSWNGFWYEILFYLRTGVLKIYSF